MIYSQIETSETTRAAIYSISFERMVMIIYLQMVMNIYL